MSWSKTALRSELRPDWKPIPPAIALAGTLTRSSRPRLDLRRRSRWARTDGDSASGGADIEFIPTACLYGMDQTRRG